jgi:hydrogenase/urease accessory protein HupE
MFNKLVFLMLGLIWASTAAAHGEHVQGHFFLQHIVHPLLELDHLLVILAAGLWVSYFRLHGFNRVAGAGLIAAGTGLAMSIV